MPTRARPAVSVASKTRALLPPNLPADVVAQITLKLENLLDQRLAAATPEQRTELAAIKPRLDAMKADAQNGIWDPIGLVKVEYAIERTALPLGDPRAANLNAALAELEAVEQDGIRMGTLDDGKMAATKVRLARTLLPDGDPGAAKLDSLASELRALPAGAIDPFKEARILMELAVTKGDLPASTLDGALQIIERARSLEGRPVDAESKNALEQLDKAWSAATRATPAAA